VLLRLGCWATLLVFAPALSASDRPLDLGSDADAVCAQLVRGRWSPDARAEHPEVLSAAQALYRLRGCRPLWFSALGRPTGAALKVIDVLADADARGLDAADYADPVWPMLRSGARVAANRQLRAAIEFELTLHALRYARDLHRGRIDPATLGMRFDLEPKRLDLASLAERLAVAAEPAAELARLEPPFSGYRRLRAELRRYVELARGPPPPLLPELAKRVLDPGDAYPHVDILRARLGQFGDFFDVEPSLEAGSSARYEGALVVAVQRFQSRHGLLADGRIGQQTWAALNTPISQRVQQIRLSLERWRWLPTDFSRPPIVVNIPEFRLRAVGDDGRLALDMPVVVGKSFRTQTPVFAEMLRTVVFRPSWTVPLSIVRGELLPRLATDPGYFDRHDYEVVGGAGLVLTPQVIEDLRLGRLALRQRPGPANALGRVKFLFPNNHAVYLHDTPATAAFDRARRDLSHGCVRVQDPEALAVWVLREQSDWGAERVHAALVGDREDYAVPVLPPIPVYLVYVTALVDAAGDLRFFDDIYGHDARLQAALDSRSRAR
jgi:murein L,D-transpeptidase YcbB/YkuD